MAGWLSSKLKEAEQFLQQIDQQAAESLGKPDKQASGFVSDGSESIAKLKGKHTPDYHYPAKKVAPKHGSLGFGSEAPPAAFSKFAKKPNNGVRGINGSQNSEGKDSNSLKKKQASFVSKSSENLISGHKDDWTDLLASPNTDDISSPALASSVGSSESGSIGFSKGGSSKLPSNARKNGSQNLPVNRGLLPKDTLQQNYHIGVSSLISANSVESIKPTSSRRFRDESIKKRLDLDLARATRDPGVLRDPVSITNNIHLNGHQVEIKSIDTRNLVDLLDSKEISEIVLEHSIENGEDILSPSERPNKQPILDIAEKASETNHVMGKEHQVGGLTVTSDVINLPQTDLNYVSEEPTILKEHRESPIQILDKAEEKPYQDNLNAEDRESSAGAEVTGGNSESKFLESDASSNDTDSMTDSESDRDTESDDELERRKLAQKRRIARRKEATAMRAAAAQSTIHERKILVEKLEKEVAMLERILAEREEQQEREAAQLRLTISELLQTLELEKKSHNSTRMKVMARESELENQNAEIAKSLGALQWDLQEQMSQVLKTRSLVEDKESNKADLERKLGKICNAKSRSKHEFISTRNLKDEDYSFEKEQSDLWTNIQFYQIQVKDLEVKINSLKHSQHIPTQTEIEFEAHLAQLTDHIIQKQAQVEALSTEKATLLIRLEAVSNAIKEEEAIVSSRATKKGVGKIIGGDNYYDDMEDGLRRQYDPKRKSVLYDNLESSLTGGNTVNPSLSPLLGQLNSVFSVGVSYLRRHRWAQGFGVVYILSLHLWVLFILFMNSNVSQTAGLDEMGLPKNLSEIIHASDLTNLHQNLV